MKRIDFAEKLGISRQYVYKLIKQGRIKEEHGHIDVDHACKELGIPEVIFKKSVDDMTVDELKEVKSFLYRSEGKEEPTEDIGERTREAKARKLEEEARLKELARLEEEGRLIDADEVEAQAYEAATKIKRYLLNIPVRVSDQLANIDDAGKIRQILTDEIENALRDISEDGGE